MATINVSTNSNLSSVAYANGDTILVNDGVTLTINSSWGALKPYVIGALGTGQINISNTSTTTPILLDFNITTGASPKLQAEQNAKITIRGNWITVATSTGAANQTLFNPTNVGGVNMGYPTKVQVETASGSGIYEDWIVVPEYVAGGHVNAYGFNSGYNTAGTMSISSGGVVTGVGTAFNQNWVGARFRAAGMSSDYEITSVSSTTSMQLRDLDSSNSSYTGGALASTTYTVKTGSLIEREWVGNQENGKVLFFNPLTSVVSTGDGTNGNIISTGCKIRVPNIVLDTQPIQTTLTAGITNVATSLTTSSLGSSTQSSNTVYSSISPFGTLLLIEGSNCERIHYTSRTGNVYSGLTRGVYGTTAAAFTTAAQVYFIPYVASGTGAAVLDLDTSGTIDADIFQSGLKFYFTCGNPYSVVLKNGGVSRLNVTNCANDVTIDGITAFADSWSLGGAIASSFNVANCLGTGYVKNIKSCSTGSNLLTNTTITTVNITNCPSFSEVSNIHSYLFKRNTAASGVSTRNIFLQQINNSAVMKDYYCFGGILMSTGFNTATLEGVYFADFTNNTASAVSGGFAFYLASSLSTTVRKFRTITGGKPPLGTTIQIENTCVDCVLHNKGYAAIEGANKIAILFADAANGTIFSHFTVNNARLGLGNVIMSGAVASGKGGTVRGIKCDPLNTTTSATGAQFKGGQTIDVVSGPHRYFSTSSTSAVVPNLSDVQPIAVFTKYGSTTTGNLIVGPYSAQSTLDMYSTTGTPYLDNIGRYYLQTIGDSVIVKSTFPLKSITGFDTSASWNLKSPNTGLLADNTQLPNITTEFRMSNWGTPNTGAWTTFTSMTDMQNAFTALSGYNSNVGLDLQVRYTCTTSGTGQYIMESLFPVTLDATYNPAVHYSKYTVSGIQAGSNVGFTNTSTSALLLNDSTASGTKTFQLDYDFDSSNIPYRLDVRKPGYTFVNASGTFNQTSQSLPITQLQVLNTAGSALYISGLDSSGFTVNHTTQKITVTSNMTTEQLWSKIQDHLCLTANLTRADFFSTSNGSSYTCTYDLEINNCTLSGNGSISMPTKLVTFVGTGAATVPITDSTGTKTAIQIANLIANSRVQLYEVESAAELFNQIVPGTSLKVPYTWTANKTIRYRISYCVGTQAYEWVESTATVTSSGLSITANQQPDGTYNAIGIDGSSVTECSIIGTSLVINITDPDNKTTAQRLLAFEIAWLYTEAGMRDQELYIEHNDATHLIFLGGLKIKNTKSQPLSISGASIVPQSGNPADVIDATGGSININTDRVVSFTDSTKYLTTAKFLGLK